MSATTTTIAAVWTRPISGKPWFLTHLRTHHGHLARRVVPGPWVPTPRPILLPFLHPFRGIQSYSRSLSSPATAECTATLDTSDDRASSMLSSPAPSLSGTTTSTPKPKARLGRPRKKPLKTLAPIAAQPGAGPTYQDHSIATTNGGMSALLPAPFPKSILTPLTVPRPVPSSSRGANQDEYVDNNDSYSPLSGHSHNDLESFTSLDHDKQHSTLYRGTLFEYQTQQILRKQLGIYTHRSAGHGDEGVDLRGKWLLPLSANPGPDDWVRHLNVIVQCKKVTSKVGPRFVRELQGALSFESLPTMAILAISSDFTKQGLLPCLKSAWPMALVVIDIDRQECRKLLWNHAAERIMHGVQIGAELRPRPAKNGASHAAPVYESRPVLCFEGRVLKRLPGPWRPDEKLEADRQAAREEREKKKKKDENNEKDETEQEKGCESAKARKGDQIDQSFVRKPEPTKNASTAAHSDHGLLSTIDMDWMDESVDQTEEDFAQLPWMGDQDADGMTEEYAEYIRTLTKLDRLLVEADSEQGFSNEDWAWVESIEPATSMADWPRIEPRSLETGRVQILHPIDLSTLVQPSSQTTRS